MTSVLMATAGIVALVAAPLGVRWLVHWRHQENHAQHAAGAVVVEQPREHDFYGSMSLEDEQAYWCTPGCPDDVCRAMGECAWQPEPGYLPADPVPWEDLQSDARIEDDRDGDQTAAWFHELGEDPGPGVEAVVPVDPPPGPVQLCPCGKPIDHQEFCYEDYREDCGAPTDQGHHLPEPTRLATAADVGAARPWLDVQREWLDGQYREFYAWYRGVLAA